MANFTFKQLQDKVLMYLDEQDDQGVMLDRVKDALNVSNAARIADAKWPFMKVIYGTPISITPAATVYTLPTDFDRLHSLWDINNEVYLEEVPDAQFAERDKNGKQFEIQGQNLVMLDTPTETRSVRLTYYKQPTLMTGDGDFPDIPFPHSNILVYDTLIALRAYTTEADNVRDWDLLQKRMEQNLIQTYLVKGQSVGASAQYVHDADPYGDY